MYRKIDSLKYISSTVISYAINSCFIAQFIRCHTAPTWVDTREYRSWRNYDVETLSETPLRLLKRGHGPTTITTSTNERIEIVDGPIISEDSVIYGIDGVLPCDYTVSAVMTRLLSSGLELHSLETLKSQ